MIDIEDKSVKPDVSQLSKFVGNRLFDELCDYMENEHRARFSIEYSGDRVLLGWNMKFKKSGRTLCTVYPRQGYFHMLLVVGRKEKERVEKKMLEFSAGFQEIYHNTQEGMGQRWLLLDFYSHDKTFDDALEVVQMRSQTK